MSAILDFAHKKFAQGWQSLETLTYVFTCLNLSQGTTIDFFANLFQVISLHGQTTYDGRAHSFDVLAALNFLLSTKLGPLETAPVLQHPLYWPADSVSTTHLQRLDRKCTTHWPTNVAVYIFLLITIYLLFCSIHSSENDERQAVSHQREWSSYKDCDSVSDHCRPTER